ncbi:platelet-activating factor acetylhydrolase-like isoform X2 [Photinus pyralis]|nr:platelet-activating factor acetylhydrolase-like isoform X2 [Photinus pyralis]
MLDYSKEGLFMRLYYPTSSKQEQTPNPSKWPVWTPDDDTIDGISQAIFLKPFILRFITRLFYASKVYSPALFGEKINTENKLKCIILSHGYASNRYFYSVICNELASRGYLVAAIEHRDNSSCFTYYYNSKEDVENDVKTPIRVRQVHVGHYMERNKQVNHRADECSRLLDFLIRLNGGEVPFNILDDLNKNLDFKLSDLVGRLDLDSLTIAGHSFGGATALLVLSKRKELKRGILLDPWMFSIKGEKSIVEGTTQPLLFVNTQTFHISANVKAMEKYLINADRHMFTIVGTTHETHTDSVHVMGYWLNWFMKKLHPKIAIDINNGLMLRFLKHYTSHDENIEDMEKCLEVERANIVPGLTRPWA